MNDDLEDKEYRDAFVEETLRNGISFQIKALRQKSRLSQAQLGERVGMTQNVISRLEDPEYGRFTINTLLRLAAAFDVALTVKFTTFGNLLDGLKTLTPEALAVSTYVEEKENKKREVESSSLETLLADLLAKGNLQPEPRYFTAYESDKPPTTMTAAAVGSSETEPTGAMSALVSRSQRSYRKEAA
ncbi:MAG: transcriptional regulator, family [Gammaproteobacteria bacterium]|nr:transcriptional regulator, family [Gammaproteobacteria bacterium]